METVDHSMREYKRQWVARRRADWMAGKSCVQCGSTKDLEVDHIDPAEKVSHRIWSWAIPRRDAELAKCQVLCKECHLVKTISQIPEIPHGTVSRYTSKRYKCRCDECRRANRERKNLNLAKQKAREQEETAAELISLGERLEQKRAA